MVNLQDVCEHYGATLAEIHSQSVDNFLIQEVKRRNGEFPSRIFFLVHISTNTEL